MADLFIGQNKVDCVFDLLGQKEDDITYSVGYALSESPSFLKVFLSDIGYNGENTSDLKIHLQNHGENRGYTDIEIIEDGSLHVIIEAKKGWEFPSSEQLDKYTSRESFANKCDLFKKVIVLNESTSQYSDSYFNINDSNQIPVQVISWKKLRRLVDDSFQEGRNTEKRLLSQLTIYLRKISTMQNIDSNLVYVVSLGSRLQEGWQIKWIDIVEKHSKYFHEIGGPKGWPKEPPNFIAFRYYGKLQSIHHIDSYEVFHDPHTVFTEIPSQLWSQHFLYHLGPRIGPSKEVKMGKVYPSGRLWAALDLLLTSSTVSEARDLTKIRQTK